MPDVRSISLTDGIRIEGTSQTVQLSAANIVALAPNVSLANTRLNAWLQQQYEVTYALADYPVDHRVRQSPPVLRDWERIDGTNIIIQTMYVQAHIFTLSPLKLTVRCQNVQAGPITGEWW